MRWPSTRPPTPSTPANAGDGTVSVIDESTNQVTGTPIRVGANPDAVAVDPATHTVYVTNNAAAAGSLLEDRSVSVINGNQVTNIPLGTGGILRGVGGRPGHPQRLRHRGRRASWR